VKNLIIIISIKRRKLAWEERKLVTAGGIFHLKAQLQIEEMEKGAKSEAAASLRRCAKAALLLHSLNSPISQNQVLILNPKP